jgi:hypothetical protein
VIYPAIRLLDGYVADEDGAFPDDARVDLELIDQRRFASGFVYLRYDARS